MRHRRNQVCPIHPSFSCCGREVVQKTRPARQLGVRRIEDPSHPRGYRELRSNGEIRKLLDRKIVSQRGKCGICGAEFTDYRMSYRTISIHGEWAENGEIAQTIFRLLTGGATGKRDQAEFNAMEENYLRKPAQEPNP
jgi:hypothetical protein